MVVGGILLVLGAGLGGRDQGGDADHDGEHDDAVGPGDEDRAGAESADATQAGPSREPGGARADEHDAEPTPADADP